MENFAAYFIDLFLLENHFHISMWLVKIKSRFWLYCVAALCQCDPYLKIRVVWDTTMPVSVSQVAGLELVLRTESIVAMQSAISKTHKSIGKLWAWENIWVLLLEDRQSTNPLLTVDLSKIAFLSQPASPVFLLASVIAGAFWVYLTLGRTPSSGNFVLVWWFHFFLLYHSLSVSHKLAEMKSFLKICQHGWKAIKANSVIKFEIIVWVNDSLKFNLS
jgi:hypothetical protein